MVEIEPVEEKEDPIHVPSNVGKKEKPGATGRPGPTRHGVSKG